MDVYSEVIKRNFFSIFCIISEQFLKCALSIRFILCQSIVGKSEFFKLITINQSIVKNDIFVNAVALLELESNQ